MAVTLWHVTTQSNAEQIEAGGFRDGPFREADHLQGVYFADRPMWDSHEGIPPGWAGIEVVFDGEDMIAPYEVVEDAPSTYREWFIPAEVANKCDFHIVKGR